MVAAVSTDGHHRVVLTKSTDTASTTRDLGQVKINRKINTHQFQSINETSPAGVFLHPSTPTSIREKLHSEEKYLGRKDAEAARVESLLRAPPPPSSNEKM